MPAASSPAASFGRYSRLCARPFSTQPGSASAAIAAACAAIETLNGAAHPVEHVDHRGRPVGPTDAHAAQAEHLREGARHHRVVGGVHQPDAGVVIRPLDVFGIGRIQHQQHLGRQAGAQAGDLLVRQHGAGGIVRVGQEAQPGGRRDRAQQRIDIGGQVALPRLDHPRARGGAGDVVDGKTVLGHQDVAAGTAIGRCRAGRSGRRSRRRRRSAPGPGRSGRRSRAAAPAPRHRGSGTAPRPAGDRLPARRAGGRTRPRSTTACRRG